MDGRYLGKAFTGITQLVVFLVVLVGVLMLLSGIAIGYAIATFF
jgi:hypothetical protein